MIAAEPREAPAKRQFRLYTSRVMDYLSGDLAIFVNRASAVTFAEEQLG